MAAPPSVPEPLPEPLRLPRGTVRGFLALALMGTFAYLMLRDAAAPTVLVNAVVVVLAFYFGTHTPLAGIAGVPAGERPIWRRPRVVRGLLLLGFVGLAGWFLRMNLSLSALPSELLEILEVLGGYVLGLSLSWAFHRKAHESSLRRRIALVFRDLSAAGALGLTGFACYALATDIIGVFSGYVEQALSLVITYYFGSRVISR